jgi:hypothetical protein
LGMRAKGHGDFQIEAHPRMHYLMNLRPKMKVATHLCLACRIKLVTRSPSRSGRSPQRSQGGGGSASEVTLALKAGRWRRSQVGGLFIVIPLISHTFASQPSFLVFGINDFSYLSQQSYSCFCIFCIEPSHALHHLIVGSFIC